MKHDSNLLELKEQQTKSFDELIIKLNEYTNQNKSNLSNLGDTTIINQDKEQIETNIIEYQQNEI